MTFADLVQNWGGFEKLVAELNRTGDVTVEHNVKLKGKSGVKRQIDVLIRHKHGLYEHLVVIECKHWKRRVDRQRVDALLTTMRDLNASRGDAAESRRLRAELKRVTEERDILKKAAAYFAKG